MGGDEVNLNSVAKLPEITAALKRDNVTNVADLYRLFIAKMNAYAKAQNRTLHVWEGFKRQITPDGTELSSVPVSTDIIVSPFDCNIYLPPLLAQDGYKVSGLQVSAKCFTQKKVCLYDY
jgi:hypothetical protein